MRIEIQNQIIQGEQIMNTAKIIVEITQEERNNISLIKTEQSSNKCIKKIVIKQTVIKFGHRIISRAELKSYYDNNELMMLGLVSDTGELSWETAPTWDHISDSGSLTLYRVNNPAKRIPKVFKSLPVNLSLPYSVIECKSNLDTVTLAELNAYKAQLMDADLDVYFELEDKSGDIMRSGICRISFLDKLKKWAESIGGSFYTEAIC